MTVGDTAVLVIDVQQKLLALVPDGATLLRNVGFLVDGARLLDIQLHVTEQYPKGLGPTVPELSGRLPKPVEKVAFSCCAIPELAEALHREARSKVVLAGIETHVCIQQTALDLIARGFQVFVPADAVASRYSLDHETALRRMEQAGAVITTSEAAVFEWTGAADCPRFKEVSRLVRGRMAAMENRAPGQKPGGPSPKKT